MRQSHSILRRSLATATQRRSFATVNTSGIPVIDFNSPRRHEEIAQGFKKMGFVYLGGHPIRDDVVSKAFTKSAEFFNLPHETKSKLAWEDPRSNRGYVQIGRERVTNVVDQAEIAKLRAAAPDFKESMEIGRDWGSEWKNMWPQESDVPGFKTFILDFFQQCHDLHVQVMQSIAVGLNLEPNFFDDKIQAQDHNLRLLSYPQIKTDLLKKEGQARAGAHTDYGTLTLLFQDSVGGLQVQNPITNEFTAAPPIPGTIVINAGDLLARWSNDVLRSTLHRVVAPPTSPLTGETPKRQSIAFFCNPNFDADIECLPNCWNNDVPKKYPSVKTGEYIVKRLSETYT